MVCMTFKQTHRKSTRLKKNERIARSQLSTTTNHAGLKKKKKFKRPCKARRHSTRTAYEHHHITIIQLSNNDGIILRREMIWVPERHSDGSLLRSITCARDAPLQNSQLVKLCSSQDILLQSCIHLDGSRWAAGNIPFPPPQPSHAYRFSGFPLHSQVFLQLLHSPFSSVCLILQQFDFPLHSFQRG